MKEFPIIHTNVWEVLIAVPVVIIVTENLSTWNRCVNGVNHRCVFCTPKQRVNR